jgi:hypothetical protein
MIIETILFAALIIIACYFIVRGTRVSIISGMNYYLISDIIEYALPFILIFTQSIIIEFSIINRPWNGIISAVIIILAGTLNYLGRNQRQKWENNIKNHKPAKWGEWIIKKKNSGLISIIDKYCRY